MTQQREENPSRNVTIEYASLESRMNKSFLQCHKSSWILLSQSRKPDRWRSIKDQRMRRRVNQLLTILLQPYQVMVPARGHGQCYCLIGDSNLTADWCTNLQDGNSTWIISFRCGMTKKPNARLIPSIAANLPRSRLRGQDDTNGLVHIRHGESRDSLQLWSCANLETQAHCRNLQY